MIIYLFEHTDKEQHVSKKVDLIKMKSLLSSHKQPVIYLFIYLFIYYDLLHTIQIHKGN